MTIGASTVMAALACRWLPEPQGAFDREVPTKGQVPAESTPAAMPARV